MSFTNLFFVLNSSVFPKQKQQKGTLNALIVSGGPGRFLHKLAKLWVLRSGSTETNHRGWYLAKKYFATGV